MKNKTILISLFFLLLTGIFSCKKENDTGTETFIPFEFVSLVAAQDTVSSNEEVTITATAKGNKLQYVWDIETGALLGEGHQIIFIGSSCCAIKNEIKCTVKDSHSNSETKTVTVIIKD